MMRIAATILFTALWFPAGASAQAPTRATVDSLRAEIARLQAQLDSLRARLGAGAVPGEPSADSLGDALARIRAAAAAAVAADTAARPTPTVQEGEFVGRQRNLNILNPEISVTGDVLAFVNSENPGGDNFVAREFEVAFQSNLDPYSRAKIYVAHHVPGGEIEPFEADGGDTHGEEGEIEIEEGYVEWVNLPGGLGVTLGKFRQRFGRLNRWHSHALPAQQLPLPYLAFLGEEGLSQAGVSVHWLAPIHGAGTYEIWTEVTRSSSAAAFGESHRIGVLGHVNAFWQLSPTTYFELGATGVLGPYAGDSDAGEELAADFGSRIWAFDFTLDWTPPDRAKYRQAMVHGGLAWSRHDVAGLIEETAFGGFVMSEVRLGRQWLAGGRFEYTENPLDARESTWLAGPTLTWWQSEWVRVRAEYQVVDRPGGRFGQFVLQTTFAMGPHKHETY